VLVRRAACRDAPIRGRDPAVVERAHEGDDRGLLLGAQHQITQFLGVEVGADLRRGLAVLARLRLLQLGAFRFDVARVVEAAESGIHPIGAVGVVVLHPVPGAVGKPRLSYVKSVTRAARRWGLVRAGGSPVAGKRGRAICAGPPLFGLDSWSMAKTMDV